VIGSQAILASVPSGLPVEATRSIEADILPIDDPDEAKADLIDGLLGEASMFQQTHGIYAQGVGQHTARLPQGWQDRLIPIRNENTAGVTGWCLDAHDLCASKLLAARPKDIEFCRALLDARLVDPTVLSERLAHSDATSNSWSGPLHSSDQHFAAAVVVTNHRLTIPSDSVSDTPLASATSDTSRLESASETMCSSPSRRR
jgi:hypothetical protein